MALAVLVLLAAPASAADPAANPSPPPASSGETAGPSTSASPAAPFATPEDAIAQYVAGIGSGNFDEVLAASAVDQKATRYRFDLAAQRFNAFLFGTMLAPATNPFYQQLNQDFVRSAIARRVLLLSYSLLSSEPIDVAPIAPVDLARAEQFMSEVDPKRLAGLSLVEARFPSAKVANDPKLLASFQAEADEWGADELTERAALITLDGKDYLVGFTLLRYGPTWLVADQVAGLLTIPLTGIAVPATQAQFETLTSAE